MTTEQRFDNIDTRLERLVQASVEQRLSMEQQRQSIEALVAGMGKVSKDTTVPRLDLTELKEITQRQAETTDRLIRIVERLTSK